MSISQILISEMRISLFVLSYNSEAYIERNLNSIINQDLSNYDVFINDDASSDSSLEIINEFISKNLPKTKSWKLVDNDQNFGINVSIKRLLRISKNPWVKVIAGDDEFSEGALKKYENLAKDFDPRTSIFLSNMHLINENSEIIGRKEMHHNLIYQNKFINPVNFYVNTINAPSVMIGSENYRCALDETNARNAEDWPILVYSVMKSLDFILIQSDLVKYRIHESSLSSSYNLRRKLNDKKNKIKDEVILLLEENYKKTNSIFAKFGIFCQLRKITTKSQIAYFFFIAIKILNLQYILFKILGKKR